MGWALGASDCACCNPIRRKNRQFLAPTFTPATDRSGCCCESDPLRYNSDPPRSRCWQPTTRLHRLCRVSHGCRRRLPSRSQADRLRPAKLACMEESCQVPGWRWVDLGDLVRSRRAVPGVGQRLTPFWATCCGTSGTGSQGLRASSLDRSCSSEWDWRRPFERIQGLAAQQGDEDGR